ncbi:MAG: amidohydrolase family protein [Acidimicrobiia bacterium]|nr:amidohydrolase family protein [Acidimicrobiia bacterium]
MKKIALVCAALALAASTAAAQDLVITNARVIVGNGQVIERGSIVVKGGRIASVSAGAPAAAGGTMIDARGMTAMAGFIDGHRHIMGGNAEQYFQKRAQAHMMEFLEAGYTTLLDGGGTIPAITQLKERVDSGQLKGPRIITSARADPDTYKTEAEARARVREIVKAGVEFIKVRIEPPADAQEVAILTAVADEAKKLNRHVMVHAVSPKAMLAAVKAGATKLVHTPHNGWLTTEEAVVVRNAGIEVLSCIGFGVPVFGVHNQENTPTFRDGKPWPESINNVQPPRRGIEAGEKAVNARTLWDAGVVFGYGTDTGYAVKAGLAHELRALNLMFSPQDLIRLLGPNTAAFLDREKDLGTLEPGKLADIVLLDGNPLEGYWNLLNTKVVIKGGTVMVDKR